MVPPKKTDNSEVVTEAEALDDPSVVKTSEQALERVFHDGSVMLTLFASVQCAEGGFRLCTCTMIDKL